MSSASGHELKLGDVVMFLPMVAVRTNFHNKTAKVVALGTRFDGHGAFYKLELLEEIPADSWKGFKKGESIDISVSGLGRRFIQLHSNHVFFRKGVRGYVQGRR